VKAAAGITRGDREYQDHHSLTFAFHALGPVVVEFARASNLGNSDRSTTDTSWVNTQPEHRKYIGHDHYWRRLDDRGLQIFLALQKREK
jgi:hypothetical protein